ncbi:MAG: DUF6261 family protein [Prevotellaceae bacterium]|jgi:Xaa-Pro aminopeptidase|nr:DUF6261 family protein [Prevotellaceae bacterium]
MSVLQLLAVLLQIQSINLIRFKNGAHLNFMKSVLQRLQQSSIIGRKAKQLLADFEAAVTAESNILMPSRKSQYTAQVAEGDRRRDTIYMSYKKVLQAFGKYSDLAKVAASARLQQQLKDFGIRPQGQLDDQTGKFTKFIDELQGQYAADIKLLGLAEMVSEMKAGNDEVIQATAARRAEKSDLELAALKTARRATDRAYKALIQVINALITLEGEAQYVELVNYLNTLITDYKRNALGQKAPNLSTGSDDTGNNGDDDDDVPQG